MTSALLDIPTLTTGSELEKRQSAHGDGWVLEELAGRLVEIRSVGPAAALTFAIQLVLEAQQKAEPVAWFMARDGTFYPPDAARNGIDFEALALVRMKGPKAAAVAADRLLTCGAFGLLILDLGDDPWFPNALQNRLVRHAEDNHTAVVCLTEERRDARTLSSLVSLRAEVSRRATGDGFECTLRAARDRRHRPGWTHQEDCDGTVGMC
jgi:recombination protein RecA